MEKGLARQKKFLFLVTLESNGILLSVLNINFINKSSGPKQVNKVLTVSVFTFAFLTRRPSRNFDIIVYWTRDHLDQKKKIETGTLWFYSQENK